MSGTTDASGTALEGELAAAASAAAPHCSTRGRLTCVWYYRSGTTYASGTELEGELAAAAMAAGFPAVRGPGVRECL
jgi:hypothetical protein